MAATTPDVFNTPIPYPPNWDPAINGTSYPIWDFFDTGITETSVSTLALIWVLGVVYLLNLAIFPFYRHIFNCNQSRDKGTPVFQVLNHSYQIARAMFITQNLAIFIALLAIFLPALYHVFQWVAILLLFYLVAAAEANHYLLSLLAIQRFILYFYKESEKYLTFSDTTMKRIIKVCYGFVIFHILSEPAVFIKNKYIGFWMYISVYTTSNLLLIGSAVFYIPIIKNIQKLSHLASAQLHKPQRFVLWQIISIVCVKCIYIPIIVVLGLQYGMFDADANLFRYTQLMVLCKSLDTFTLPLIIQMTYLGCNRKNLEALLASLNSRNVWRIVLCPCSKPMVVEPVTENVQQLSSTTEGRR
ncbi:hypothetical protein GCK72_007564 [Caenorhabditis remanei]|uniref:Serpentine Receptor, class Z n=1 Tax=Caenorhabditis remanei TaxID=31234 RepID=A0A6A5HJE7_CAERE|nr:hypothetical protein GCK72_007564 [Caenorhabditis remanei]KAF1767605.1 hypothetical protein GCK72_007564 [Caenorhabditis remanei]